MAPKKVAAAEVSVSLSKEPKDQETAGPGVSKAVTVKKISHPSTMEMVKEALMVLDQRKGVSIQAIRTFIKQKYTMVGETRLKTMLRRTILQGIASGIFVRPANSTMTGAQGRLRLAVRKPQAVKSKEAKASTNPINKDNRPKAKAEAVKTKNTQPAAVGGNKPKKTDALASKVAPAKKPKAKPAAGTSAGDPEPKTRTSKASRGESEEKPGAKKEGRKVVQKAKEGSDGARVNLVRKKAQEPEGGNEAEVTVQKKGRRKAADGEQNGSRTSGKKGKKVVEK